jgi:hypothetical protein
MQNSPRSSLLLAAATAALAPMATAQSTSRTMQHEDPFSTMPRGMNEGPPLHIKYPRSSRSGNNRAHVPQSVKKAKAKIAAKSRRTNRSKK